jgi:hypothetical protein
MNNHTFRTLEKEKDRLEKLVLKMEEAFNFDYLEKIKDTPGAERQAWILKWHKATAKSEYEKWRDAKYQISHINRALTYLEFYFKPQYDDYLKQKEYEKIHSKTVGI